MHRPILFNELVLSDKLFEHCAEIDEEMCIRDRYMAHCKEKKLQKQRSRDAPVTPHGKQTVKQIIGQNQGISNIEITDPSIKEFEKIARKYGVDYACLLYTS